MEDIILNGEMIEKKLSENIIKFIDESFSKSYSNPLLETIEEELKKEDGIIRQSVRDILAKIVSDETFKEKIGQEVVKRFIEKGLKN